MKSPKKPNAVKDLSTVSGKDEDCGMLLDKITLPLRVKA